MDFMIFPTTLQEYSDGSLKQKKQWFKAQYRHHRFIIKERDNANGIHAFNRFEKNGFVERFQCYFRLLHIPRVILSALTTPAINEKIFWGKILLIFMTFK